MREGYIKIFRKMFDNPDVMKDSDHIATWVYLLAEAEWKPTEDYFNGKKITLKPGQFTIGRKQIAEALRVTESKIQRILKRFENEHLIEQQTSNRNRLITIVKWNEYQQGEQQNEQQMNNQRTTDEQQMNTPEEVKNIRSNSKSIYGEFNNVKLTDAEYEKLVERFPMDYQDRIENLSQYMARFGKKYKSHYATILSWARKDEKKKPETKPSSTNWLDELIEQEAANGV